MDRNYWNNGEVKANRGNEHEYLGITFYLIEKGKIKIDMDDYVKRMINKSQMKIK